MSVAFFIYAIGGSTRSASWLYGFTGRDPVQPFVSTLNILFFPTVVPAGALVIPISRSFVQFGTTFQRSTVVFLPTLVHFGTMSLRRNSSP
jgi:hypothetical protein